MDGSEWLQRVFEPALRTDDPAVYPALIGALEALAACGVLDRDTLAHARARLDARFEWLAPPDIDAPGTVAPRPHDALEAVLAPARPLADVDGLIVLLVSVELWTTGIVLRLAGLRNTVTDELDAEYQAAMAHWVTLADEAQASGHKVPRPHAPGERLLRMPLSLRDDVGTRYELGSRHAGGLAGAEWRSEWRFEPGVPAAATRLTISVDAAGDASHAVELDVPARPT